ncbi:MAG: hypothetical protein WBG81_02715 [Rhodanobacter sp.]|jgi:hypothetical protein|nr:hypothetical protein [Rhodanobacter sp. KK11]MDW2980012.1 hypothetical protein [Rhodanobacter sp. KK11]
MSQRSSHCRIAEMNRLATVDGLLQLGGTLLLALVLVLVLLITNGGAG